MKRSEEIFLLVVANILILLFLIIGTIFLVQFFDCFGAASRLPVLKQCPVMHILIYGSGYDDGGETISARISLADTGGTEFAVIERSWKGTSLSVDFVSANFSGKSVLFPYRIYGSNTGNSAFRQSVRQDGIKLASYFTGHGVCLLFGPDVPERERHDLYVLSRYALGQANRVFTKFTSLHRVDLSGCRTGTYYTIYTGFDGKIALLED